jgi:outer membrane protein assembly factor BamB
MPLPTWVLVALLSAVVTSDTNWPGFRGTRAAGIAEGAPTPETWDVPSSRNLVFRTPVPGLAHSSPVLWGDRLFLTTAVSGRADDPLRVGLYGNITPVQDDSVHRWQVLAFDKTSGTLLWERTAHEGVPKIKRHPKSTHANPTPATDGRRLVASFGSEGLYCYDFSGKLLWKRDLGRLESAFFQVPEAQWGFASSPILYQDMVIVQADVLNDSFLAAFSAEDGRPLWRTGRSDVPTWSTPNVVEVGGRPQIVVNGWKHMGGYDARTGEEIWRMRGGGDIPVPTPVMAAGLIFITQSHGPGSPIYAIRPSARGEIAPGPSGSSEHVAWSIAQGGAYMQTPLVYGEYLYVCRDNGALSCFKAKTGELMYRERLGSGGGGFSASPVAADGKLYFTSEEGQVYVVRAGPKFEVLATNELGEITMATPAISEGRLYFRTRSHLLAVGAAR